MSVPTLRNVGVSPAPYPLRASRLAVDVAAYVCELIFSGQLPPGTRIQPLDLTEALGISTTPIREALALLEKDGLVTSEPRRGYTASRLTRTDIRDVFELEAYIESKLAHRALELLTDADLQRLEQLDSSIAKEAATGDPARVGELNRLFHESISRRPPDANLLRQFMSSTWRFRPIHFYSLIPGWIGATRHDGIVAALRAKDAQGVDQAIRSHTATSCELLVRHLESTGFFEA